MKLSTMNNLAGTVADILCNVEDEIYCGEIGAFLNCIEEEIKNRAEDGLIKIKEEL